MSEVWYLIIALTLSSGPTMTVLPREYPSLQRCQDVGMAWIERANRVPNEADSHWGDARRAPAFLCFQEPAPTEP
jgi:hypothetical protein